MTGKNEGNKTEGNEPEGNKTKGNTPKGNKTEGIKTEGNKIKGNKTEGNKNEGNKATEWDSNPQLSHSYILFLSYICPTFFYFFVDCPTIVLQFRV